MPTTTEEEETFKANFVSTVSQTICVPHHTGKFYLIQVICVALEKIVSTKQECQRQSPGIIPWVIFNGSIGELTGWVVLFQMSPYFEAELSDKGYKGMTVIGLA